MKLYSVTGYILQVGVVTISYKIVVRITEVKKKKHLEVLGLKENTIK